MPLNALDRKQYKVTYDWTPTLLQDFARYFNRWGWRKYPWGIRATGRGSAAVCVDQAAEIVATH